MDLQQLEALQATLISEYAQSRGMFTELAHIEALLAETYRDRIQYELLQNSDDAGATEVDVTVHPNGSVIWTNNGRPFNQGDAEALCRSASSSKVRGDSIGYRGIGFKSLAAVASRIEVRSSGVSFAFDRAEATALLDQGTSGTSPADIPLIRIPSSLSRSEAVKGAAFAVTPLTPSTTVVGEINPLALLFLRHVQSLTVTLTGRTQSFKVERQNDRVRLSSNENSANFAIIASGNSTVALPLDDTALSMCTLRGRLACFLPLDDSIGLPLVVSGDILTDPSRTHAVVADNSTQTCLAESARAFASQLAEPRQPWFQRGWELLTMSEDPRSTLASGSNTADRFFMERIREDLSNAALPFSVSPIPIHESDLPKVFPAGAPASLYRPETLSTARALRAAFGLPAMDVAKQIISAGDNLTPETIEAARTHVESLVKALGRQPNDSEKILIGNQTPTRPPTTPAQQPLPSTSATTPETAAREFPAILARWRTAELAVLDWLNSRGWQLTDVSKQNLGYDLVGLSPDGDRAMIEIKKVPRPDAQFAMTNNEMGAMHSEVGRYLLGIVVGDGRYTRLMLLDPTDKSVPRERVCRAWEWQFIDWSRHGTYVN
jgi:hypothetical protein